MIDIHVRQSFLGVISTLLLIMLINFTSVSAQEPLKVIINKEKDHFVQISGSAQFWLRYTEMNPGSTVRNELRSDLVDFSMRRYRLNFHGRASERFRYTFVLGNNNVNYYTYKNFQVKILDAFVDYQVNDYLGIGVGKNGWTGLSRYAAPSATQPLAYDIDFVSIPMVVVYDDILRRFGIYARGSVNNFDYRVSLSRPFFFPSANLSILPHQATFADKRPLYQFSTYVKYQFLEKEQQVSPWSVGTYLGKKNILNVGAGMLHQPNTTWFVLESDTVYYPISSFAADLFYEQPFSGNKALTFYLAYFNHNLGKNFIRNIGINNPASGGISTNFINGPGNRVPAVGTGNILYTQGGYLLPVGRQNKMQIQPYASMAYGILQALEGPMVLYNTGFNYYLNGQSSKLTVGYENRPIFNGEENQIREASRKGIFVLQYQFKF